MINAAAKTESLNAVRAASALCGSYYYAFEGFFGGFYYGAFGRGLRA